jgi:hypothetical protein
MAQRDRRHRGEPPPKTGYIGALVTLFFMFAVGAFESLFAQTKSHDSSAGSGTGYNPFGSSGGGDSDRSKKAEKDLKDAFQFFDCSLSQVQASSSSEREETRSLLKKKWRKFSLLHHPDRNGNSEESVLLSQQLNHHYDLACQEIDRLEGNVHEDDAHEDESSFAGAPDASNGERNEDEDDDDNYEEEYGESLDELLKKQMRDLQKEGNRVQQDIRKNANYKKNLNKKKRRFRNQGRPEPGENMTPNLYEVTTSETGRDRAHNAWVRETNAHFTHNAWARERHAQDDDVDTPEPRERPKHLLIESSTDDIALAIRLGKIEAATLLIRAKVMHWQWLHKVEDDQAACVEVLKLPIDKDYNTYLHYAAYYESTDAVNVIMMMVGADFPAVVLKKNYREQLAVDLCIASNNDAFKERMELITKSAREASAKQLEEKKLWSRLKRINIFGSLHSLLAFFLIGRLVFGCGNVVSFMICLSHSGLVNDSQSAERDCRHTSFLFIMHIFWKLLLFQSSLLRVQPIPLYLLVPAGILLCCVSGDAGPKSALFVLKRVINILSRAFKESAELSRLKVAILRVAGDNTLLAKCLYLLSYGLIALAGKWLCAL